QELRRGDQRIPASLEARPQRAGTCALVGECLCRKRLALGIRGRVCAGAAVGPSQSRTTETTAPKTVAIVVQKQPSRLFLLGCFYCFPEFRDGFDPWWF